MYNFCGKHILADYKGIKKNDYDISELSDIIHYSCKTEHISVVHSHYYKFDDGGYTIFFLLKESHLSIHYYMEQKSAFIDVFTCGSAEPIEILTFIENFYMPSEKKISVIQRGDTVKGCD